jgi:hypothetical protein
LFDSGYFALWFFVLSHPSSSPFEDTFVVQ